MNQFLRGNKEQKLLGIVDSSQDSLLELLYAENIFCFRKKSSVCNLNQKALIG